MSDYPTHHPFPQLTVSHLFRYPKRNDTIHGHSHGESRWKWKWRSWLYQTTFGFFILLIAVLLAGSAWALSQQALRGGPTRWNVFLIIAAYVALAIISIAHIISRRISIKRILRTMPKPYVPTKRIDLPKAVADHIMVEYSRTAVIAHISQATKGWQEGWGRPGTKWENQHFRTYILSTLPKIHKAIPVTGNRSPTSLKPLIQSSIVQGDQGLLLYMVSYEAIIERARYGRREPGEEDAMAAEKCVDIIMKTIELKRLREKGGPGAEALGSPFRG